MIITLNKGVCWCSSLWRGWLRFGLWFFRWQPEYERLSPQLELWSLSHCNTCSRVLNTSIPPIHHSCTGSTVIYTSPICESTPLPMCSPLLNLSCSISMMRLKAQPGFSRCLWFCSLVSSPPHEGLLCTTARIRSERVHPSPPLWLHSSQMIITFLPDWWRKSSVGPCVIWS